MIELLTGDHWAHERRPRPAINRPADLPSPDPTRGQMLRCRQPSRAHRNARAPDGPLNVYEGAKLSEAAEGLPMPVLQPRISKERRPAENLPDSVGGGECHEDI